MTTNAKNTKTVEANACRWCDIPKREHSLTWTVQNGFHYWEAPTDEQRKARMLVNRTAQ